MGREVVVITWHPNNLYFGFLSKAIDSFNKCILCNVVDLSPATIGMLWSACFCGSFAIVEVQKVVSKWNDDLSDILTSHFDLSDSFIDCIKPKSFSNFQVVVITSFRCPCELSEVVINKTKDPR